MVTVFVDVLDFVVGFHVRLENSCVQVKGHIQKIHNFEVGLNCYGQVVLPEYSAYFFLLNFGLPRSE